MIVSSEAIQALQLQALAELRGLTEEEAFQATDHLLAMASQAKYPDSRDESLGLIERQRILYGVT